MGEICSLEKVPARAGIGEADRKAGYACPTRSVIPARPSVGSCRDAELFDTRAPLPAQPDLQDMRGVPAQSMKERDHFRPAAPEKVFEFRDRQPSSTVARGHDAAILKRTDADGLPSHMLRRRAEVRLSETNRCCRPQTMQEWIAAAGGAPLLAVDMR